MKILSVALLFINEVAIVCPLSAVENVLTVYEDSKSCVNNNETKYSINHFTGKVGYGPLAQHSLVFLWLM